MYFPISAFALTACAGMIHLIAPHQSGIVDEPAGWVLLSAGIALVLVSRRLVRR
jgi:hypothetical protein